MQKSVAMLVLLVLSVLLSTSIYAKETNVQEQLRQLEAASGGRLGISAINTANNKIIQYRADERFPMGCTSKVIGVAAVLQKSTTEPTLLEQKIKYRQQDLVAWAPITEKHLADGMTIKELCEAAIIISDNTAMNLLVKELGGLQEINSFAKSTGNMTFRADHLWPAEAASGGIGNVFDSSTPAAMRESFQKITLGNILAPQQKNLLLIWLKNNTTGYKRIRAGVPKDWIVGDKTGTGSAYGTTNDIAIIWPPNSKPIIIAIYFTRNEKNADKQEEVVAAATRVLINKMKQ